MYAILVESNFSKTSILANIKEILSHRFKNIEEALNYVKIYCPDGEGKHSNDYSIIKIKNKKNYIVVVDKFKNLGVLGNYVIKEFKH